MDQKITTADVIAFLENTPDFFAQHPDILAKIQIKSADSDQTISFADHQIAYLRDKMAELEQKMIELLEFGLENDELLTKYHKMAIALIRAKTLSELFESVYQIVKADFALPHVAIRIWPETGTLQVGSEFDPINDIAKKYIEQQKTPYMGALTALPCHTELADCFLVPADKIGSVALVPLRNAEKVIGVLLIGSDDKTKFGQQMGTLFLEQMAEQVAAAISKNL